MIKIDLKAQLKNLYQPGAEEFVDVVVPPAAYLAIDGHGDPNTEQVYTEAVMALYTTAYAVKQASKQEGVDFVVGPLEGLWSSDRPATFTARDKAAWDWTMLIPLPAQVAATTVEAGLVAARRRRPERATDRVRRLQLDEGRVLQILHVGSYDDEGPVLARLHREVMPGRGLTWNGRHHEIYLSDPRRVPAERLRTVLRQPVRPASEA